MISRYLNSKNIISQIKANIDEDELLKNNSDGYYHLSLYNYISDLYFYRNLFTTYELNKIIHICKKIPHKSGTIGNNKENYDYRNSNVSWIPVNSETEWIYKRLAECILKVNSEFYEYDLTRIEQLQFAHYSGDVKSFYAPHLDVAYGNLIDVRKLTFVLQLSDDNDYSGGELKIHTNKDPFSIEKEKGLISFFPSHILHECTPVTSGTRYSLVGWVHGPKLK